jgi:hypothetical protein
MAPAGQVEKNVRDSRQQMVQCMPGFSDLAALNAWLEERCLELGRQTAHGKQPGTIADVWTEEQAALMPLPVAFDGFIELSKRVSPTCLISFDRNRYSVPASFANRPVSLRIYPDRLVVAAKGNILCEHALVIQRSHHLPPKTIYDWRHYLAVVQRKPGALRNGDPFWNYRLRSDSCRITCCASPPLTVCKQTVAGQRAAIGKWSTSLPWCDSTMNRPCSRLYLRVENGKANLARAESGRWLRMVDVPLNNGAGLWPLGDRVSVVERWTPPVMQSGSASDLQRVQTATRSDAQGPAKARSHSTVGDWPFTLWCNPEWRAHSWLTR